MYKIIAFFFGLVFATSAFAQTCPTRPATDSSNACASTQFVATRPLSPSQLPNPTASTKGGVISSSAPANQFATGINTSAAVTYAQPTFSNLATGSVSVPATWLSKQTYGSGTYAATANYGAGTTATLFQQVTGSSGTPSTSQDAAIIFQKWSGVTSTSGVNSTLYSSIYKTTTGANTRASAIFAEAQDTVGGTNTWVEGIKTIASITGGTLGSGYGGVFSAGTGSGISYQYLVGVEGTVENQSGVNAPTWGSFNINGYGAGVSVTCGTNNPSANKCDVGYVTGPYSGVPFRTGFAVYGNDGSGRIGVDDTGYAIKGSIPKGIDLSLGTYSTAAIILPNLGIIRALNAAGNAYHNLFYYDASNQLTLGTDATAMVIAPPTVSGSYIRATSFISNGTQPTIIGSGSCTISTQTGGATAGTFKATAACAAGQTYTLSGMPGAPTGYVCDAGDRTTSGVVFQQTSDSTTTAVFTIRTTGVANNDIIQFKCQGY